MDLFPSLGEPGILDELFWFGPIVLQFILGGLFFWLTGRMIKKTATAARAAASLGLLVAVDILLFVAFMAIPI